MHYPADNSYEVNKNVIRHITDSQTDRQTDRQIHGVMSINVTNKTKHDPLRDTYTQTFYSNINVESGRSFLWPPAIDKIYNFFYIQCVEFGEALAEQVFVQ